MDGKKIIIYIPGLGYDFFDISSESYSYRYQSAYDKSHPNKKNKYKLEHSKCKYGKDDHYNSNTSTIIEISSENKDTPIAKIYEFEYQEDLVSEFNSKNIFIRSFLLFFALLKKLPRFLSVLISKSTLSLSKRMQTVYFGVVFLMISFLGIMTLPSLISFVFDLLNKAYLTIEPGNEALILPDFWQKVSQLIITLFAIIIIFIPTFKEFISGTATEFLCLDYFLSISENKLDIIGKLEALIEKISEDEEYESIEIHGYSFGSIILLDLLFPYGAKPALRVQKEIKTILTIGCPYDFINTYYPEYFDDRNELSNSSQLKYWFNFYSTVDVFSSNFRYDEETNDAELKIVENSILPTNINFNVINPKSVGFLSYLLFMGIRVHRMFWGSKPDSINCLTQFMQIQEENKKSQ